MGSASAKFCDFIFKHPGIFINLKGLMIMIMIMMIMNVGIKQLQKNNSQSPCHQNQSATKESLKLNTLVEHMGFHFRVTNAISNVV